MIDLPYTGTYSKSIGIVRPLKSETFLGVDCELRGGPASMHY